MLIRERPDMLQGWPLWFYNERSKIDQCGAR
jgi:hypothetical protein